MSDGRKYYWCVAHGTVEDDDNFCRSADRLGPYDSADAAAHALDSVRERNERLDAEDREWDDPQR